MRIERQDRYALALVAAAVLAACGDGADSGGPEMEATGLAMSADVDGNTDVAAVLFEVASVDCLPEGSGGSGVLGNGSVYSVTTELEDVRLGGTLGDVGTGLDDGSSHIFADQFLAVEAGCYVVTATPQQALGLPSADCSSATMRDIEAIQTRAGSHLPGEVSLVSERVGAVAIADDDANG